MIRFTLLNKQDKDLWLPRLFDLLYDNMRSLAPSGLDRETEKQQYLAAVSPALDKAPRQILLCFCDDQLAGFLQYYTRDNLLMVEEVQLCPALRRTFIFYRMCAWLARQLPAGITVVEAYADTRNIPSRRLMEKLGMTQLPSPADSPFVHFRGHAAPLRAFFRCE